jgi:hypothetical protein
MRHALDERATCRERWRSGSRTRRHGELEVEVEGRERSGRACLTRSRPA